MSEENLDARASGCLLISGASSGLGREMAVRLSDRYPVILCGRDEDRLIRTLHDCSEPERHHVWRQDLSDVGGIADGLANFLRVHELRIAGFVHSAAQLNVLPLRSFTPELVGDIFRVNLFAALEIVRTLTRKKVNDHRLKSVVFISSIASRHGAKGFSAYGASKGGLDALMKCLAVELAPTIRVNSVLPGAVQTAMTELMFNDPDLARRISADYPLGVGQPADVVDAVEFLLSSRARWITGQQLIVDGGRTTNITA